MTSLRQLQQSDSSSWPEDAGEIILAGLRGESDEDRQVAVELCGEWLIMDDHIARELLAIIGEDSYPEELRGTAAIALGPVLEEWDLRLQDGEDDPDPEETSISRELFTIIRDRLQAIFRDDAMPVAVRAKALEAAIRAPMDWHRDAVSEAYSRPEPTWRVTAVFCMGLVGGFDEEILASLDAKEEEVVFEAVRAAGVRGLAAAGSQVLSIAASDDADIGLRLAAIEALGSIPVDGAEEMLLELSECSDEDLAEAAEWALSERTMTDELGTIDPNDFELN